MVNMTSLEGQYCGQPQGEDPADSVRRLQGGIFIADEQIPRTEGLDCRVQTLLDWMHTARRDRMTYWEISMHAETLGITPEELIEFGRTGRVSAQCDAHGLKGILIETENGLGTI